MGIDAITEKIINDATEYAEGLISEANGKAEKIIQDAMIEAESITEKSAAKSVKDSTAIINKLYAEAELEARKMRLAVKQKEFNIALEAAIDRIAGTDPKVYTAFLAARIAETGVRDGELKLNAKDRKSIGKKLIKAANDQIKGGKLKLSNETIGARGGFVLNSGDIEIDSTLETMVVVIKDNIAAKVVAALFHT